MLVKVHYYIVIIAIMAICICQHQAPETVEIGPSPTVASMAKFTDFPVVGNTGTPNIEIPIGIIKGYEIELPVNLKYHGSGVKVEEEAGWVGMGWSLQAAGTVSRSVRGYADDEVNLVGVGMNRPSARGWLRGHDPQCQFDSESLLDFPNLNWFDEHDEYPGTALSNYDGNDPVGYQNDWEAGLAMRYFDSYYSVYTDDLDGNWHPCWWQTNDIIDTEPDIYSVNAFNLSFQFTFDNQGDIRLLNSADDIKIEYEGGETYPIETFTIWDKKGNKFTFGDGYTEIHNTTRRSYWEYDDLMVCESDHETCLAQADKGNSINSYTTAWLLIELVTNNNEQIIFDYDEWADETYFQKLPEERGACPDDYTGDFENCINPSPGYEFECNFQCGEVYPLQDIWIEHNIESYYLTSITSSLSHIEFVLDFDENNGNAREDLQDAYRLQEVVFYNTYDVPDKQYSYMFNYIYDSRDYGSQDWYTYNSHEPYLTYVNMLQENPYLGKRLFLSSITKHDQNGTPAEPPYEFEYTLSANGLVQYGFPETAPWFGYAGMQLRLPPKHSSEQDYWGYYNGNQSLSMIPRFFAYPVNGHFKIHRLWALQNAPPDFGLS